MLELSVVTVCMNRQQHLLQTAPKVQAWAAGLGLAWEHLVVDWSSDVPIQREHLPPGASVRLLRVSGEQHWSASRAYNFGCFQAQGERLMRLDADCWPQELNARMVHALAKHQVLQGAVNGGSEGSWLMSKGLFQAVGGFHELLQGYGCDDIDLRARLQATGVDVITLPKQALGVIHHSSAMRVAKPVSHGHSGFSDALNRAWKDALVEANRWAVVQHPWSSQRSRTTYIQSLLGAWEANVSSIPLPSNALASELQDIRRLCFWSTFLLIPARLFQTLPRSWFGELDGDGFGVRRWHRLYWHSGRRFCLGLRLITLKLLRRAF